VNDDIDDILCIIGGLFAFAALIGVIFYAFPPSSFDKKVVDDIPELALKVKDMVDNASLIYKYTSTPDILELNDEELAFLGGDCKDWTEYYDRHLPEGLYSQSVTIKVEKGSKHMFLVVSDDLGYCLIDGLMFRCWDYNNDIDGGN